MPGIKRKRIVTIAFFLLFFLIFCQGALADKVKLKNGNTLIGTIIKEDKDSIMLILSLKTGVGKVKISKDKIELINGINIHDVDTGEDASDDATTSIFVNEDATRSLVTPGADTGPEVFEDSESGFRIKIHSQYSKFNDPRFDQLGSTVYSSPDRLEVVEVTIRQYSRREETLIIAKHTKGESLSTRYLNEKILDTGTVNNDELDIYYWVIETELEEGPVILHEYILFPRRERDAVIYFNYLYPRARDEVARRRLAEMIATADIVK